MNFSINALARISRYTTIKADLLYDEGHQIGYPALPMDVGFAKAAIGALSLVYNNPAKHWYHAEAKVYANRVQHAMDDSQRPDVPIRMDMPGTSFTSGMYAEASRRLTARQQLTLRADVSVTHLQASMTMHQPGHPAMYMLTWPNNRQLQPGIAAQYTWRTDSLTQLQLNARADVA